MKKLLAIFLLAIFLYNLMGYFAVFYLQQEKIQQEINQAIDQGNISEQDLIVFKVPIITFYFYERDFERAKGDFEYEGRYYEMVKQKLQNDTIYVYCINNEKREQLQADLTKHMATHVGDTKSSESGKDSEKIVKNFIKEYLSQTADIFSTAWHAAALLKENAYYCFQSTFGNLKVPSPPPKIA